MKLIRPSWVGEDDLPIYSVDISPDDLRFATCGRGDGSGKIVIWNMGPLLSEELDANENIPKILSKLDAHVGCVNCVRWNPDGKLLASCSDDKTVMVYRNSSPASVLYKGYLKNVEVWRIVGTLSGHKSDVLDLAWSPKHSWVASCSVDNTVIVWDIDNMTCLMQLKGHSGLVKGVAWDPLGQYLSSQSNDKTLRVWRTKDWKEEVSFSKPFLESSDMTLVTRGSWSPDGQYIVGANAWNSGGPVACIIPVTRPFPADENDLKEVIMDFVGHRKPVTCVKFHPGLWMKKSDDLHYCVLGTVGRDCSIAIWKTCSTRPLCVLKNFFSSSVSDLSWTKKGQCLIACSPNSGVAAFNFEGNELGLQCSQDEKTKVLLSIYGEKMVKGNSKVGCIVETPEVLMNTDDLPKCIESDLTENTVHKNRTVNAVPLSIREEGVMAAKMMNGNANDPLSTVLCKDQRETVVAELKQVERRTSDGKRRITPITLPKDTVLPPAKIQVVIEESKEVEISPLKRRVDDCPPQKRVCLSKSRSLLPLVSSQMPISSVPAARAPIAPITPSRESEIKPLKVCSGHVMPIGDEGDCLEAIELAPIFVLKRVSRGKVRVVWQFPCNGNVCAIACNNSYVVIACSNPNTIQFLDSKTGWPSCLPVLISGKPAYFTITNDNKTLLVTTQGHLYVYDEIKLLMSVPTLRDCLLTESNQIVSVVNCRLTESNVAIVSLTNGKTIAWSRENSSWLLISDKDSVVWNAGRESALDNNSLKKGRRFGVRSDAKCTAAYLHQEMTAAKTLGFSIKYRVSLLALVRHYAQEGELLQLRHLLQNVQRSDSKDLLDECLNVMKHYEVAQRLFIEFREAMECDEIANSL